MTGKIIINIERCKGCGLCVMVCPKGCIVVSEKSNKNGFFPAQADNTECTGCAACAIICPEAIIEVFRDQSSNIETIAEKNKKPKPSLIKEKA
ncbi:MAG: 4Fe-4S dicluster domain-containing protein [Planctomycetota bacterium]|jgi:2-oxoglutarate ferredoxin oxidoreductase subunit delta